MTETTKEVGVRVRSVEGINPQNLWQTTTNATVRIVIEGRQLKFKSNDATGPAAPAYKKDFDEAKCCWFEPVYLAGLPVPARVGVYDSAGTLILDGFVNEDVTAEFVAQAGNFVGKATIVTEAATGNNITVNWEIKVNPYHGKKARSCESLTIYDAAPSTKKAKKTEDRKDGGHTHQGDGGMSALLSLAAGGGGGGTTTSYTMTEFIYYWFDNIVIFHIMPSVL